jgi:hypothetical protein
LLAYRLAKGSGILDVERWLDTIPPEIFNRWVAYDNVEKDPLLRIAEILKLGFATLANNWGANVKPENFDPLAKPVDKEATVNPMGRIKAAYQGVL